MQLKVKNLTIVRDRPLLENVNISCNFKKLQLSGKNGSGKSTFIAEFLEGNKKIEIDAKEVIHVHNKPILFENLSITSNFELLAANGTKADIYSKYFQVKMSQKVKTLSGGQKQILHILVALSHRAQLYIIDEPFNNLDINNRKIINEILEFENSNMLIVAHGYNLDYCDTHLKIEDRKLCYEK